MPKISGRRLLLASTMLILITGAGTSTIVFDDINPVKFESAIGMADNTITNLATPSNPKDAATKNYVDQAETEAKNYAENNDNVVDGDSSPNNEGADNKCTGNKVLTGDGTCNSISGGTGGSVFFGDGIDGDVVDSDKDMVMAETYTVTSGHKVQVDGVLFVTAEDKITVNGVIDASGEGASGTGGGIIFPREVEAAQGHVGLGGHGGGGGLRAPNTDQVQPNFSSRQKRLLRLPSSPSWDKIYSLSLKSSGGHGGASGKGNGDVHFSGAYTGYRAGGGSGGSGGGSVVLMAPEIEINGKIDASGEKGFDGMDVEQSAQDCKKYNENMGGGGGGGGGAGGTVILTYSILSNDGNIDVSGGKGGEGGMGCDAIDDKFGFNGNPGGDGSKGELIKIKADTT